MTIPADRAQIGATVLMPLIHNHSFFVMVMSMEKIDAYFSKIMYNRSQFEYNYGLFSRQHSTKNYKKLMNLVSHAFKVWYTVFKKN